MDANYLLLLAVCFFLGLAVYYYFTVFDVSKKPYRVNTMNPEVFCCQMTAFGRLQTQGNSGQLQPGYIYATSSQINQALLAGMRVPGVATGDIALYLDNGYAQGGNSPNAYLTSGGDFSSNHEINFTPTTSQTQTTYWVFIFGNKPTVDLRGIQSMIFVPNNTIVTYQGILPWNSPQWNSDIVNETSSGGAEVFLANIVPAPSDLQFLNDSLHSGYTLASTDQLTWSISRGLAMGSCYNVVFNNGKMATVTIPYNCATPGGNVYAIWGKKPKTPNTVFSTFSSTNIYNFNDKKYSLYQ